MKSELLLPVANMSMCLAAIHNGAGAIYVGVPFFNARGRSQDLSMEELKEMVDMCHLYGVKVHFAFNVLIFEEELPKAKELIIELAKLGPDAIIIQDLGLAKMVRSLFPKLVIHGSTQMTVTNHLAMEFLDDLEIERFVLGRENSLDEIREIREKTDKELEVFVHGALCVAYSGQCFTSEGIGGRSANRGQCAQSCRFSYQMIVDDKPFKQIDKSYLVSPKDLCGIAEVEKLQEMGVESFKVEGRLKGPAYVASVASNYRDVLDGSPGDLKQRTLEMAQTYSRGFFSGWLHGVDHQNLVDGYYGDNRGPVIGKIQKVERDKVVISSELSLAPGQGVLFASEGNQGVGSKIYQVEKRKQELILGIDKSVSLKKIKVGDQVYLNSSPELNRQLEKSYTDLKRQKRIPIEMLLTLKEGQLASLKAFDQRGNSVEVLGEAPLEAARKAPRLELIRDELSSLSRTAFSCPNPEVNLVGGDVFIQQKAVKKLRQKMLELLVAKRVEVPNYSANEFEINSACDFPPADNPQLNLVLRQKEQVDELIANLNQLGETSLATLGVAYLDFEFGQHYRPSVEALKAAGVKVGLTTNRILKPGEYHHLKNIIKLGPDVYLVRNLGAAKFLTDAGIVAPLKGDFSLNVANSLSADYLFDRGFETLTLSYDLNQKQLYDLIKHSKSRNFEITIHQYMPSFHMEHCVFAAFLSQGHSYKDCGKPCEKHKMELIDQFGNSHFIKADSECRNTMFNGQAQSGSFLVKDLIQMGVSEFRLEFLFERGEELTRKLTSYLALISGEIELSELVKNFHTLEKYGFGSGQVLKSDRYKNRKKR